MTTAWYVARETEDWVGPITVTDDHDGNPATVDASALAFTVLPKGTRPTDTDWSAPVADPDSDGTLGVQVHPVTERGPYGIWVRLIDGTNTIVLEPANVGYVIRT